MDRGAWRATVQGFTKTTRLSADTLLTFTSREDDEAGEEGIREGVSQVATFQL